MRCETTREVLSARIDGEQEPVAPEKTDQHLRTCARCRSWYADAQRLQRRLRVRAAPAVPDLAEAVLERIPAPTGQRWPVRIALCLVAIAQLAVSMGQLLGPATSVTGMPEEVMAGHVTHETAAWNFAIGVGLLWAALRPKAAVGQLPVLTGFVLVLGGLSVVDIAENAVTPGRLLSHAFVLIGLILLFIVRRQHRDDCPATGDRPVRESRAGTAPAEPGLAVVDRPSPDRRKPTGRHRAV